MLAERCETCIFRPGNRMHLEPGRVKAMVQQCERREGVIPCHMTIWGQGQPAICRGFYDSRTGRQNSILQVAERLGYIEFDTLTPE